MSADSNPRFVSASQMARKADIPLDRFLRAVHRGLVVPDVTPAPNLFLFDINKLPAIRRIIGQATL